MAIKGRQKKKKKKKKKKTMAFKGGQKKKKKKKRERRDINPRQTIQVCAVQKVACVDLEGKETGVVTVSS